VAAGKAYSNILIRWYLRRRGISHTIPEKSDSQAAAGAKDRGGRPPGFDAERYKKRNTVERAIYELKQFRGRHQLRQALLHLPRHDDGCRAGHLAALLNTPSGR